jgi:hypothetical protein
VTWPVPAALRIPWNADVLAFLERARPSAHSDVASELARAACGLPGARAFCPAPAGYAWVALHTPEGRVFGLAYGMKALALRLGPHDAVAALRDRGERAEEIGPGWIVFDPFLTDERSDATRARLARFCRAAFDEASGPAPGSSARALGPP